MTKTRGRNGAQAMNGEAPPPAAKEAPLRTVNDVLKAVEKGKFRASAKTIWRRNMIVLGAVLKDVSDDEIGDYLVIPRSEEKPELRRDDLLVELLRQRARHRAMDVYTFAELTRTLPDSCQKAFAGVLVDRFASNGWPAGVATVRRGKSQRCLLLTGGLVGATAATVGATAASAGPTVVTPPSGEAFARAFSQAFERLRRERPFNMVELLALRSALPGYSREQFDRGLHDLRRSGEFLLETFEGRHGSLTPEELAASIREDGRVFAYATRRDRG